MTRSVAMILFVAALGCTSKRAGSAPTSAEAPPPAADAPGAMAYVDALAEAEAELAANKAELNALGVKIAWGKTSEPSKPGTKQEPQIEPEAPTRPVEDPEHGRKRPTTNPTKPANVEPAPKPTMDEPITEDDSKPTASTESQCKKICTLAGVACDLSKRICQLAEDHAGDARYEDACWNAGQQCEEASDACSECTAC